MLWALGLLLLPVTVVLIFRSDEAAVASSFLIGPACALAAGILLGVRVGRSPGTRVALSFLFIGLCLVACEALLVFGCVVGGPKLDFR